MPDLPKKKNKKEVVRPAAKAAAKAAPGATQRVADLAWAGQHAAAIKLATAPLKKADLSVSDRLDLLDLRAESFIAQGDLAAADEDAKAMLDLARRARKPAFLAQSLNRRALLEIRYGNS